MFLSRLSKSLPAASADGDVEVNIVLFWEAKLVLPLQCKNAFLADNGNQEWTGRIRVNFPDSD